MSDERIDIGEGAIPRWDYRYQSGEMAQHPDGEYVLLADHVKAVAEAYVKGVAARLEELQKEGLS